MKDFLENYYNEAKTFRDNPLEIKVKTETLPFAMTVANTNEGVMIAADSLGISDFDGDLDNREFKKFKKEMKLLFDDFDTIFSRICNKYGLKLKSKTY